MESQAAADRPKVIRFLETGDGDGVPQPRTGENGRREEREARVLGRGAECGSLS